jgi:hypothetical protein
MGMKPHFQQKKALSPEGKALLIFLYIQPLFFNPTWHQQHLRAISDPRNPFRQCLQ